LIDPFAFKIWWCCINPEEKALLIILLALSFSLTGYVERSVYDGLLISTGVGSPLKRGECFTATYYLTPGVFVPIDGEPIDVVYFGLVFWLAFAVFVASPENDCSDGCRELNYT